MMLRNLVDAFTAESSLSARPRPYVNHAIQLKGAYTAIERANALQKVGLNIFSFPAYMVTGCDMLSDSGTAAMTNEQWAALHLGDESYGSNKGYFVLMERIGELFGNGFAQNCGDIEQYAFLFHQGRSGEDALFTLLGALDQGQIIPSNGHFDTTLANIQKSGIEGRHLFSPKLLDDSQDLFRGDMDTLELCRLLTASADHVPVIFLTVTNNAGGGQPVSMRNIQETYALSRKFSVPLFFDACRFAENAWFIKNYEAGYADKSIAEIVKAMFSYVDGFIISFKKDGLASMGGGIFSRRTDYS